MDSSLEDYKESKKGKLVSCKLKKKDFCMQALNDINFRIDLSVRFFFSYRNVNIIFLI